MERELERMERGEEGANVVALDMVEEREGGEGDNFSAECMNAQPRRKSA